MAELTAAQVATLEGMCQLYEVEYRPDHYTVREPWSIHPGWAHGWLGGIRHANPYLYELPVPEATERPTFYAFVDPDGGVHGW